MAIDSIKNKRSETPSGAHIGIIKQTHNSKRDGSILVWIPHISGGNEDDDQHWIPVRYASPFYGVTNFRDTLKAVNDFEHTRHSYGMWMSPPDVGTKVIVIFLEENNINKGYWIACVPEAGQHYMVPSVGASTSFKADPESQRLIDEYGVDQAPVTEYNGNLKELSQNSIQVTNEKPVHKVQTQILAHQGLLGDKKRGNIDTSSVRETPSGVFGISTPGRDIKDQVSDEKNVQISHTEIKVDHEKMKAKIVGRKGGHSFVMDDGDVNGNHRMVRLRSAAGNQILMSDTDGFIYISNSEGTNWIEMTADGQILIYAQGSVSIRTEKDLNFRADNNVNIEAGNNVNIKAFNKMHHESRNQDTIVLQQHHIQAAEIKSVASKDMSLESRGTGNWKTAADLTLKGSLILLNTNTPSKITDKEKLKTIKVSNTVVTDETTKLIWKKTEGAILTTLPTTLPTHEPYSRGVDLPESVSKKPAAEDPGDPAKPSVAKCSFSGKLTPEEEEGLRQQVKNNPEAFTKVVNGEVKLLTEDEVIANANAAADAAKTTVSTATEEAAKIEAKAKTAGRQLTRPKALSSSSSAKAAPSGFLFKQPDPANLIGNLNEDQMKAYYTQVGFNESTHNYSAINPTTNFVGKYQFGFQALQDAGLVKKSVTSNSQLTDSSNWISPSTKSLTDFLDNEAVQEEVMESFTSGNFDQLRKTKVITNDSTPAEVAGSLQAAHLLGAQGYSNVLNAVPGSRLADASGTTAHDYYSRGYYSVDVLAKEIR